jgi:hypothetical protein
MRNLFALLGAALVTFVAVGWYLDWYKVKTEPDASGHREVNIDINGPKIKEDLHKGRERLEQAIDSKANTPAAQAPAPSTNHGSAPAPAPASLGTPSAPTEGPEFVIPAGGVVPPPPEPGRSRD